MEQLMTSILSNIPKNCDVEKIIPYGSRTILVYYIRDNKRKIVKYSNLYNDIRNMLEEIKIIDYLQSIDDPRKEFITKYTLYNYEHRLIEMDRIDGEDMDDLVNNKLIFNVESITYVGYEMIMLINFIHMHGVSHRDIKLANFILTLSGHIYLIDFGLSCFIDKTITDVTFHRSNLKIVGTIDYMAPEVIDTKITQLEDWYPADIFSFGVCMTELMTLRTHNKSDLISGEWQNDIMKYSHHDDVILLVQSCLNMNPLDRPTSIQIMDRLSDICMSLDKK